MRHAFTLIEVMVAVVIISYVGWGVLALGQNTTHNLEVIKTQQNIAMIASPLLIEANINNHNKNRSLYDFLKERYVLNCDPMIDMLKGIKLEYKQKEFAFIHMGDGDEDEVIEGAPKMGLSIQKIWVNDSKAGTTAYTFEVVQ